MRNDEKKKGQIKKVIVRSGKGRKEFSDLKKMYI